MFKTWPGDWQAAVKQLVCEDAQTVCVIDFIVGADVVTSISIFEVCDGRICKVIDYWPEPYEPPPRMTPVLKRRAQ